MQLTEQIWVFPSDRSNDGVTSWWLNSSPEPVLIDCPDITTDFLTQLKKLSNGRKPKIILTSKYSHSNAKKLQAALRWPILLQEQEAYLLPGLRSVESFSESYKTSSGLMLLWTPGPTPGSCVVHAPSPWNVLFCGRLLIPVSSSQLSAFRTKNTFHWTTQIKSLKKLRDWIPRERLPLLASGAGFFELGQEKLLKWEAWKQHKEL